MVDGTAAEPGLFQFSGLVSYSRAEVQALNCYSRLRASTPDWKAWLQESFATLLETYERTVLRLHQKNEIEKGEAQTYTFEKGEVTIGRSSESDVVLGARSIGKQHARILLEDGRYCLEDLGSAVGTFLNNKRLVPHESLRLEDGDQMLIFPYSFEVEIEEVWRNDGALEVIAGEAKPVTWNEYLASLPVNFTGYEVRLEPGAAVGILAVDTAFLTGVISRTMRVEAHEVTPGDLGIVEFLLASVLQRGNSSIPLPFQFSLCHLRTRSSLEQEGCALRFVLGVRDLSGAFQLFVPSKVLSELEHSRTMVQDEAAFQTVTWRVVVNAGSAHLSAHELSELDVGDIVLIAPQMELVLPASDRNSPDQGWTARQAGDHPVRIEITGALWRNRIMDQETNQENQPAETPAAESSERPLVDELPIRLEVILDQVDLKLTELRSLTAGSILELDRAQAGSVQLAANGTLIGLGELVNIEGRMGVRVTEWNKA
jgi:type III secretion system YscQ/HrcQ family protein